METGVLRLIVTITTIYGVCDGQGFADTHGLIENLTTDYDVRIRPAQPQKKKVELWIASQINTVLSFDDITGIATYRSQTFLQWIDERLTWESKDFDGLDELQLPRSNIWVPSLVMLNSPNYNSHQPCQYSDSVRVFSSGKIRFVCIDVIQALCTVDITYYPFDSQSCSIKIVPSGYLSVEVALRLSGDLFEEMNDLSGDNSAWDFTISDGFVNDTSDGSVLTFGITLIRRQTYTIVNLIIPIFILGFINTWVFLLPAESGERTSFSMTVLLSFVVYMGILNDNIPRGSEPLARLSVLLSITLFYSVSVLFCTIISLRLYNNMDKKPVPRLVQRITHYLRLGCLTRSLNRSTLGVNKVEHRDNEEGLHGENSTTTIHVYNTTMDKHLDQGSSIGFTTSHVTGITDVTWDMVGATFDFYAFIIYIAWWGYLLVTVIYLA